jgi:soluble lytic murein transglycosylase-like protein
VDKASGSDVSFTQSWRAFGGFSIRCAAMAGCVFLLLPRTSWCQIYVNTESPSGSIVLSNFKVNENSTMLIAATAQTPPLATTGVAPVANRGQAVVPVPSDELRSLIASVAARANLSPELLHAVILAESRYDPRAVSRKGAIGLMQLLPSTGKRFGAEDLFSVQENLVAGASYLKWLMGMFGEDLELVLAAYNAGEQAVIRAGRKIPAYPETQAYVRKVLASIRQTDTALH